MDEYGVPAPLLEFQRTLRVPGGGSAAELLKKYDEYTNGSGPEVAEVHSAVPMREVAGWRLGADITVPLGEPPFPALVYLHGGGWTMGSPWTHRRVAAELAARGLLVISVDYRRAPKHRFPGAVEDAAFAVSWALQNAGSFGGDPDRVLLGGDSAGANLAAAVLATGAGAAVRAALLCYGIYDYHRALPTVAELLGGADAEGQQYLEPGQFEELRGDPRLSPEVSVADFPPTLVAVGAHDPLYDESSSLAAKLAETSVPHQFHIAAEAPHGYLQLPSHPAHNQCLAQIDNFVRSVLG